MRRRDLLRAAPAAVPSALAGCAGRLRRRDALPAGTVVYENRDARGHEVRVRARRADDARKVARTRRLDGTSRAVDVGLLDGPGAWLVSVELDRSERRRARIALPADADAGRHLLVRVSTTADLRVETRA